MGLWDDVSSAVSGGSSSSSSSSISLPSISFPSLNLGSAPSIPSFGSLPGFSFGGGWSMPSLGIIKPIESIQSSINNVLSTIPSIGMPKPIAELQSATIGNLTQFQQDFNAQLTSLGTSISQGIKPFLDKITDVGALMELLSNPETIIIIVAVVAAVGIALYLLYKFYWSKIEFGESVADKYTSKGLEAAKIFK